MSNNEMFEQEFKNRLKKETNKVTELKEETWNNISRELFFANTKKPRTNWFRGIAVTLSTLAVVAIMLFALLTGNFTDETQKPDPAEVVNDPDTEQEEEEQEEQEEQEEEQEEKEEKQEQETLLADQFVHEKQIEIELEGMKEPIQVQLATNEEWKYIIYFDKDRYQFVPGVEVDEIVLIDKLDDEFPEVSMKIQQISGTTIEEVITGIKAEFASEGMSIVLEESVNMPINGVMIAGEGNVDEVSEWNSPVHRYYIMEDENDNLFVFKQMFFVEAWEGHGARFDSMLETFEIVQ